VTLRNGLTEEQARLKLRAAGVPGVDDVSGDALADICDRTFAPPSGGKEPPAITEEPADAKKNPRKNK